MLEIGGNSGHNALRLAEMFPKSTIISSDIVEEEVEKGRRKSQELGAKNIEFKVINACDMPVEWSNKFDLVFAVDVLHDIPRADKAMKEIHRVLKPEGSFLFNDVNAHSCVKDNATNPQMSLIYSISLLYCLPLAMNAPDTLALGTAWGKERAINMLKEAGFKNVQIIDEDAIDYLCIKDA